MVPINVYTMRLWKSVGILIISLVSNTTRKLFEFSQTEISLDEFKTHYIKKLLNNMLFVTIQGSDFFWQHTSKVIKIKVNHITPIKILLFYFFLHFP